jgi:mRNA interferase HicA
MVAGLNIYVDFNISVVHLISVMNAQELKRLLARHGCTFETHKGGSGHITVRRGDRKTQLPMHGSRKELGKGLVNKILKDLGLR